VILAAGLTPAYQLMMVFEQLRLGEVNRAQEAFKCASGKVLNVGLALHHLGGPNLTLALVGGVEGESIDREFASLGINHRWVWSSKPTRTCTTILERSSGVTTELVENAAPADAAHLDQFVTVYKEVAKQARIVVLSGSLPAGTPKTFYRDLIGSSRASIILDASGQELLAALSLEPFCVKPNREELGRTLGRELRTDDDLRSAIREVCELGAEWVIVSQGSKALWAGCRGKVLTFHPARVPAVNPIGSGDCLAAGLAWAIRNGMEMVEAIQFGMAAAAENATMMLPGRLDLIRVRARMSEITHEEV
jgi:1-phosphofructokinase family hexose kinase